VNCLSAQSGSNAEPDWADWLTMVTQAVRDEGGDVAFLALAN